MPDHPPPAARDLLLARLGRLPAPVPPSPPIVERVFTWDGIVFERYFDGPHDLPADALAAALIWVARTLT